MTDTFRFPSTVVLVSLSMFSLSPNWTMYCSGVYEMRATVHCIVAELEDTLTTVTLVGCTGAWAAVCENEIL